MRVLITGGAGYIGSHTARLFAETGMEPIVYDNLSRGHRWAVQWGPLIVGDLADREKLTTVLREQRIDAVVHFAAYAYVGESMGKPGEYFRNNTANSLNLLECMHEAGVKTIIFSSSCAVYGTPVCLPITEDHSTRPVNPYGESKLMIEKALHWYGECHGFRWVALRYFNAAGAHTDAQIGEVHDCETHLIPLILQTALKQRERLAIYGNDYPTADGTAVRDYIHVMDLGQAHLSALKYLCSGGENDIFNLGTGDGHSVYEVMKAAERIAGCTVPFTVHPRRPGDPAILVAEPSRAFSMLGWKPYFSDLRTILETAYGWETSDFRKSILPSAV